MLGTSSSTLRGAGAGVDVGTALGMPSFVLGEALAWVGAGAVGGAPSPNGRSGGGCGQRFGWSRGRRKLPLEVLEPLRRGLVDAVVPDMQKAPHVVVLVCCVLRRRDIKIACCRLARHFVEHFLGTSKGDCGPS
jgi:hypothetical protein